MPWADGNKKLYNVKPDRNTKFTLMGWMTGTDWGKVVDVCHADREAALDSRAASPQVGSSSSPARTRKKPKVGQKSAPQPAPIPITIPPPGPTPITIPTPGPTPINIPLQPPPAGANLETIFSVSNQVGSKRAVPGADGKQYPLPYPYPIPYPVVFPPPPTCAPGEGLPFPQQPTARGQTQTFTKPVPQPVYGAAQAHLPSQVTFVAAHHCAECGRPRSADYHRRHPLLPGTVARSGVCRRCRNKDEHRVVEVTDDQPVAYVVGQEERPRKHRERSSERRRVQTETVVRIRSRSRSVSPSHCRRSSPIRGRYDPHGERGEPGIHYRSVSVRRRSEPLHRAHSRHDEDRGRTRHSREYRREYSCHDENRPAHQQEGSREYRQQERVIRVSDHRREQTPARGSELVVRREREILREEAPKHADCREPSAGATTGSTPSVSSNRKPSRTEGDKPFDVRAQLAALDRQEEEKRRRKSEVTEVRIERIHRVAEKPKESKTDKKGSEAADKTIEINRIRQRSEFHEMPKKPKDDDSPGPVVHFRYVTPSHHDDRKRVERTSKRKDADELRRKEPERTQEVVCEEELGSFRYVPAPETREDDESDETIVPSAHGSLRDMSSRVRTVRYVESEGKEKEVYRENEAGGRTYLGSFRHVKAQPEDDQLSDHHHLASKHRERQYEEEGWDDEDVNISSGYRHVSALNAPRISRLPTPTDSSDSQADLEASNKSRFRRLKETFTGDRHQTVRSQPQRSASIPNTIKHAASLHNRKGSSGGRKDGPPTQKRQSEIDELKSSGHISSLKQRFEQPVADRSTHSRELDRRHSGGERRHYEESAGSLKYIRCQEKETERKPQPTAYSPNLVRYYSGSGTALDTAPDSDRGRGSRADETPQPRRQSRVRFVSPVLSSSSSNHPSEPRGPPSNKTHGDALAEYKDEAARIAEWEKNWSEQRRRDLLKQQREKDRDRDANPPRGEPRSRRPQGVRKRVVDHRQDDGLASHDDRHASHHRSSRSRTPSPLPEPEISSADSSSRADYVEYSTYHNQPRTPPPAPSPPNSVLGRLPSPPIEGFEGLMNLNPEPASTVAYSERSLDSGKQPVGEGEAGTDTLQNPSTLKLRGGDISGGGVETAGNGGKKKYVLPYVSEVEDDDVSWSVG